MLSPSRGPERLVRIGQWAIALLFAYFLIKVGGSLIADLPSFGNPPRPEAFEDRPALERLALERRPLELEREGLERQHRGLEQRRSEAEAAYRREQQSFETWQATRAVTAQGSQNPEVVARARRLDQELQAQRLLAAEATRLQQRRQASEVRIGALEQRRQALQRQGQQAWQRAQQRHTWVAFLIRLGFVLPLLLLALHLFRRHRASDQWPFVWGFLLFALFAFFVELVPYLPSFGDYIRYGVGAVLTLLGGRWLMGWLKAYLERQQREQLAPQAERQRRIRYEQALQTLARRQCPGCERQLSAGEEPLPDYCMHCGLPIQANCPGCGHHHVSFFPFCPACGSARPEGSAGTAAAAAAAPT